VDCANDDLILLQHQLGFLQDCFVRARAWECEHPGGVGSSDWLGRTLRRIAGPHANRAVWSDDSYSLSVLGTPNGCAIKPLGDKRPGTHKSIFIIRDLCRGVNDRLIWKLIRQIQSMADGPSALADKGVKFFDEFSCFLAYGRENEFSTAVVAHPQAILIQLYYW
jgi:hypothetical protein